MSAQRGPWQLLGQIASKSVWLKFFLSTQRKHPHVIFEARNKVKQMCANTGTLEWGLRNYRKGKAPKAAASNVPFLPGLMQNKQSEVLQKLSAVSAGSEQLPDDSFFETLMKVTFCSEPPSSISQTKEL